MYDEQKYLRDELSRRLSLNSEHPNKTINMVLLIWGGVLALFAKDGIRFTEIGIENMPLYFIGTTIFFISNVILYYTAQRYHNDIVSLSKLTAYIAVFYEKRPSDTVKAGENCCWELATFETVTRTEPEKSNDKGFRECTMLANISVGLMWFILTPLFLSILVESGVKQLACIIAFLVCAGYIVVSMCLVSKLCWYKPYKKGFYDMKAQHMQEFIKYALETKHYTEDEVKERFGKIYDLIETESVVKGKGRKK